MNSVVEFDDTTGIAANPTANSSGIRAAGPLALQSPSVLNSTASPFSGSYAFAMAGNGPVSLFNLTCFGGATTKNYGPISMAGAITFGSGGAITSGEEDVMMQEVLGIPLSCSQAPWPTREIPTHPAEWLLRSKPHLLRRCSTGPVTSWSMPSIRQRLPYIMSTDSYTTNSLLINGNGNAAKSREHRGQSIQCVTANRLVRQPYVNDCLQFERS